MISYRSNRLLRFNRIIIFVSVMSVILSSFAVYVDFRLRDIAKAFAKSAAKTALIDAVNVAFEQVMENTDISYNELAVINRNESGLATTVEIDTVSANHLKAVLTNAIAKELQKISTITVSVPISAAFGIYYSAFETPKFEYKVHITTTVITDFKSNFYSAGINQVLHQIVLRVNLESNLAMREGDTETLTSTDFLIAQTVIVGAVPDAFTEVKNATDEVVEDIFDFGAGITN